MSSSSDEENFPACRREDHTPLPQLPPNSEDHASRPHLSPQRARLKPNNLPTQQSSDQVSPFPVRKVSLPFPPPGGPGHVTPVESPSVSRRPPLMYTHQTHSKH